MYLGESRLTVGKIDAVRSQKGHMTEKITPAAEAALVKIRAVQKYPIQGQTDFAIRRILKNLSMSDYILVCAVLETDGSASNG